MEFHSQRRRRMENGGIEQPPISSLTSESPISSGFITVTIISTFCGIVFGFAVEKSRVFEPEIIYTQMLLSKFVMMKMFLSGVISGMFCLALMSMVPYTRGQYLRAKSSFLSSTKEKGYKSAILGGIILGSGMTLAGSCPGVVFAQVGSGTNNAVYSLLGCFCGALLYGITEPALTQLTKPSQPVKYPFLYQIYGSPYFIMALPTAAFLSVAVFSLEIMFPWMTENNVDAEEYEKTNLLSEPTWPPFLSGCIVGLLQIPVVIGVGKTLGSSSSHCTIASQVLVTLPMKKLAPYLTKFQSGLDNWWQVLFILGSAVGAYLSSSLSGRYGTIPGVPLYQAFFGGIMILFGARLAGGCTSGHGLSGTGLLSMLSITTISAVCVGGLMTATTMECVT